MNLLQRRIWELVDRHISMRATARVLKVDHAYLSRLASGEKENPSDALLRKLGLRRVVTYKEFARRDCTCVGSCGVKAGDKLGENWQCVMGRT